MQSTATTDNFDISQCFEDTAILYGISAVFWLLAGLEFVCAKQQHRPRIPFNWLNGTKLVSPDISLLAGIKCQP